MKKENLEDLPKEALLLKIQDLKKEIEKYEEKLDDAEFEVESFEKKYKKAIKDLDEANTELSETQNVLYETKSDLEKQSYESKQIQQIFNKKEEAVKLINSLLSAPNAKEDGDIDKSIEISKIKDFVSDKVLPALHKYDKITDSEKKEYDEAIWLWANTQRKTWLANKKTIAFVGEFSAGKTSIINRILSQDNPDIPLLPVASKATTAIPTYISYGNKKTTCFTSPDGTLKNISSDSFHNIKKELLEEVKVSSIIKHFVIAYENEHLKGLSILDTPGFNSNDNEDKIRTAGVIKETDLLFWVVDANTGEINQSSIDIMKEYLSHHPMYIIINKADTKAPAELDSLQKHLEKTMKNANIKVKGFLMFSQKHKIDELMEIIKHTPLPKNNSANNVLMNVYNILQEEINISEEKYFNFRREHDTLDEDLITTIDGLCHNIELIKSHAYDTHKIPRIEDSFWSGTTFKMKPEEYNALIDELKIIQENSDKLFDVFKIHHDIIQRISLIEGELKKENEKWMNLSLLKEDWDRLIANLEKKKKRN